MSGAFTITATGAQGCGEIYVRTKITGVCQPGTTVIPSGDSAQFKFGGDELPCGNALQLRVYLTDPGGHCPSNGAAGLGFTCFECYQPH